MTNVLDEKDEVPSLAFLTMAEILALDEPEHRFSALCMCTDMDYDDPRARAIALSLDVPGTREDSERLRLLTSPIAIQRRQERQRAKERRRHLARKKRPLSDEEKLMRELLKLDRHGRKA